LRPQTGFTCNAGETCASKNKLEWLLSEHTFLLREFTIPVRLK